MRNLLIIGMISCCLISYGQTDNLSQEIDTTNKGIDSEYIFVNPEITPEFPGGRDSLNAFLENNNNWSVERATIVGKVYVGFVVEIDGSITNIEILKGLPGSCDKEAIRIVNLMPKWKPGKFQGKPVAMKMILPIAFDGLK